MRRDGGFLSVCMCVLYWVNLKYACLLSRNVSLFQVRCSTPVRLNRLRPRQPTGHPRRTWWLPRGPEPPRTSLLPFTGTVMLSFTPLVTPSSTITPTSLHIICFNFRYIIYPTELVYFSSSTLSFCLFFFLSSPSFSVSISFPLSHLLINHNVSPWTPRSFSSLHPIISLYPSPSPFSHHPLLLLLLLLLFLPSTSQS